MNLGDDGRAQSTLVGAILLFAILIIAFSSYQAFVVPNQNAEVEFNHNSEVQTDMQDLRNSLLDVRSVQRIDEGRYTIVSEHRPTRVRLGTQFPERLIALNPPAPSGTLRTEASESEFRIENAAVNDAEIDGEFHEDPSKLLGADPDVDLGTNFVLYRPGYSEYQDPPTTVLEHSLLYNEFQNTELSIRQQKLIQPRTNRLNIVLFQGGISQSGSQAVTLDPETLDGPTASVPIEGDDITVQVPTRSPEIWEETIDDLDGVDFETEPDPEDTEVRLVLSDEEYDLRVTRVGLDGGSVGDEQLTPIQFEEFQQVSGGADNASGPDITDIGTPDDPEITVVRGQSFTLKATASSLGELGNIRSGTPISEINWESDFDRQGTIADLNPDTSNRVETRETKPPISTSGWEIGTHEIEVRATDASGRVSPQEDRESVTVTIQEAEGPFFNVQITDAPDSATPGQEIEVDVEIENIGDEEDTQDINFIVDGELEGSINELTLDEGENEEGTFTYQVTGDDSPEIEVAVMSEDDEDTRTITVEIPGAAANIEYNGDAQPYQGGDTVQFSVTNTGESAATIQSINVDTDVDDAQQLTESNGGSGAGQHEMFIGAGDDGWYEAGDGPNDRYDLGTEVDLTSTATIGPDGTGDFFFLNFHDGGAGGSGSTVDVQNAEITVTLVFSDGSETTLTFQNGSF